MSADPAAIKEFGGKVRFGETADDYGRHRAGFPEAFFDRTAARGLVGPGRSALDLGTGTGTVARGLAARGMCVTGLDRAAAMMEEAARIDHEAGVTVTYRQAEAEATGFPSESVDLVTAGQCWHWFDRSAAAAEARRVLRPGGAIVIAHFDWLPLRGTVVEATEALIREHNPAWTLGGGTGVYPAWLADLWDAGFRDIETESFDIVQAYGHESWRGRIRASAGIGGSLPPEAVAAFDADLAALLAERFPDQPLATPHRVWFACARRP